MAMMHFKLHKKQLEYKVNQHNLFFFRHTLIIGYPPKFTLITCIRYHIPIQFAIKEDVYSISLVLTKFGDRIDNHIDINAQLHK